MKHSRHHFDLKGKNAEEFVHELALKTFLTDWCFLNPVLPDGKELCDLLVVFDHSVIIWQIKDLKLGQHGKYKKSEVEKNLRQLSGARRQLFHLRTPITLQNPRRTIETFDPSNITEVFLISVLLGEGEDSFRFVECINEALVHIFTGDFAYIVLTELDTIVDFLKYLRTKEALIAKSKSLSIIGGEEELLAVYLVNDRSFGSLENNVHNALDADLWNQFQKSAAYKSRKNEDIISYEWDAIINRVHEGSKRYEVVAKELARLTRFERRVFAKALFHEHMAAQNDEPDCFRRSVSTVGNTTYCYLICDESVPKDQRQAMLERICFVARGMFLQSQKVIGIATERHLNSTRSYDFFLLKVPAWTSQDQEQMEKLQQELGIFKNLAIQQTEQREYPE